MNNVTEYYLEWTENDEIYNTGLRIIKPDVPPDILKELIDFEKVYYDHTLRRELLNLDIEKETLISVEEGVKRYKKMKSNGEYN